MGVFHLKWKKKNLFLVKISTFWFYFHFILLFIISSVVMLCPKQRKISVHFALVKKDLVLNHPHFIVSYPILWSKAVISLTIMVLVVNPSMVTNLPMKISHFNTPDLVSCPWQMPVCHECLNCFLSHFTKLIEPLLWSRSKHQWFTVFHYNRKDYLVGWQTRCFWFGCRRNGHCKKGGKLWLTIG